MTTATQPANGTVVEENRTEFLASFGQRLGGNTAKLATSLVKAQREAEAIIRKQTNPTFNKPYASADMTISESRDCLLKHGLAILPIGFERLPEGPLAQCDANTTFVLRGVWIRRWFKLMHESGEYEVIGPYDWPTNPTKASPLHLACGATDTLSLAYVYRDVLGFPRMTEAEFRAMEKEEEERAYKDSLSKPPALAPKAQAAPEQRKPTSSAQSVAPLSAEGSKLANDLYKHMESTTKCAVCQQGGSDKVNTQSGETSFTCINGHVDGKPHPGEAQKNQTTSAAPSPQQPAQPAASTTQTQAPTPTSTPTTTSAPTSSGDSLELRRTAMLPRLQKYRKRLIDAGATADNAAESINKIAGSVVVASDGFKRGGLTDDAIKALDAVLKKESL